MSWKNAKKGPAPQAAGDPCRHCQSPVRLKMHPPGWTPDPDKGYYPYWLICTKKKCGAVYFAPNTFIPASGIKSQPNLTLFNMAIAKEAE